jgi:hypothetical protein
MTNKSDQQQNKYALCRKFIREQKEDKSAVISEVMDGTSYTLNRWNA